MRPMYFNEKNHLNDNEPTSDRRDFLKKTLIGGISFYCLPFAVSSCIDKTASTGYELSLDSPTRLFDGKTCWVHARAGILPARGNNDLPQVIMTMNTWELGGSGVFKGMHGMKTIDLGQSWTQPEEHVLLTPRHEIIDGVKRPVAVGDFWPSWHKASQTLLGTGHTVVYTPDWKVVISRPRHTAYATFNMETGDWRDWQYLKMPDNDKFNNSGAGCCQRFDMEDGTILLPIYFSANHKNFKTTVCRCSFDGKKLKYLEHGSELELNDETRGLNEPSITYFQNNFFLTMRNDKKAFVASSIDGLHFDNYVPWKFNDGTELGSYNTQQHWVSHSNGLFLVYTRRGAENDHVFRHRAPLFIAQVDPENLCVIRETEQILVPERGARLGNFGITNVSPNETWVTVTEVMSPVGVDKYGSDGSVFVAKIHWNEPNKLF